MGLYDNAKRWLPTGDDRLRTARRLDARALSDPGDPVSPAAASVAGVEVSLRLGGALRGEVDGLLSTTGRPDIAPGRAATIVLEPLVPHELEGGAALHAIHLVVHQGRVTGVTLRVADDAHAALEWVAEPTGRFTDGAGPGGSAELDATLRGPDDRTARLTGTVDLGAVPGLTTPG